MNGSIGPLLKADEFFNHQIVDTFATVQQSDYSWTEKVCGMAAARDGSLQIGFGFGKYQNRNVLDAYGGVSRGVEQWTVRASRELAPDPETIAVGPLHYDVIEPLQQVRIRLDPNPTQPIAFDIRFAGVVPCALEDREDRRTLNGFRHTAQQIRYHQTGTATGWVEVAGRRTEVTPDTWVATRDHSWGIRPDVGVPLADLPPDPLSNFSMNVLALWNPVLFVAPEGTHYAFHQYILKVTEFGFRHDRIQGGIEYVDGRRELVREIVPDLTFDPRNKRFQRGRFVCAMADGGERVFEAEAISDTGFHLGTGLYLGFDGKHHGTYVGDLHVEGEYLADCADPATVARINQFRDCLIRMRDLSTGAVGWGNCQTFVAGQWPAFGIAE
jgi:hypothetical protein